jgi:two-component sensor histidine kinase
MFTSIFTPPKLSNVDIVHEAKYILAYRMSLFFVLTIGILDVFLFSYFNVITAIIALIAFLSALTMLISIRSTGKYYTATLVFNIFGAAACLTTLFAVNDQPHVVDVFWMVINILFAFLILDYRWGLIFTTLHGISISVFYAFTFQDQVYALKDLTEPQVFSTAVNVLICFVIIGYLCWQNIRINQFAKEQLNHAQEVLQEQYNIISKQNEEKTVMLKEIHHRVKNNLQIITSLLRLQSRELENPEAIAKFKDATHRVIAMSMIHEKMYQSDHLSTMHLREYLHDLSTDLVSSYQSGHPVKLHIHCDVESIGLKSVVPLALILNELISNSLKYAFDDYDNCSISIDFTHYQGNLCKLVYSDSGTWKAPSRQGSFGLDLIESLTDQLEGTLKMETYPVTRFEFVFSPLEDE